MMKKVQFAGIKDVALSTKISMTIPTSESQLPLKLNIMEPSSQIAIEQLYDIDARNPHFQMTIQTNDGVASTKQQKILFGKNQLRELFEKLQKIQDQINSFS